MVIPKDFMSKIKPISINKKAFHNYEINEKFEAGIVLKGTEIKSIKLNKISLKEGWVEITEKYEAILQGIHISPYEKGNIYNHEPKRPRKLLLKKKEIKKIASQVQAKGMSVIPIKVYLTRQFVKVQIALAKGKKLYDKRQTDKKKEDQRSIERSIKKHNYNE